MLKIFEIMERVIIKIHNNKFSYLFKNYNIGNYHNHLSLHGI